MNTFRDTRMSADVKCMISVYTDRLVNHCGVTGIFRLVNHCGVTGTQKKIENPLSSFLNGTH